MWGVRMCRYVCLRERRTGVSERGTMRVRDCFRRAGGAVAQGAAVQCSGVAKVQKQVFACSVAGHARLLV